MSRVLIVDDDPVIRRLLQVNFRLEGFDVVTAAGGEEALASFDELTADVVVLDLTMPDVDGFSVCRQLRSKDDDVAVVIVSARSRDEDREEAALAGASAFMTKPFDPADLVREVRLALGEPQPEGAS